MGHGVGVPTLSQHRDRHDAADALPELTHLANGIHDLAQKLVVRDPFALADVSRALDAIAPEAIDLVGRHGAEVRVQGISRFELRAVDQERIRARKWIACHFVKVAEQCKFAVDERARAVLIVALEARDEVVVSFEIAVFWHTTMKQGGTLMPRSRQIWKVFS